VLTPASPRIWSIIAASAVAVALSATFAGAQPGGDGAVLYNGIRLLEPWPPQDHQLSLDPVPPPYLSAPPAVIPIDVGRQLFVDDFLVADSTLERVFHLSQYYQDNPVVDFDRPWEHQSDGDRRGPLAMAFSDGCWYDPADGLFKLWYHADYGARHLCMATSRDGVHWDKPEFDVVPGTNIVMERPGAARVVWLDLEATDPARRFVLITTLGGEDLIPGGAPWWGSRGSMWLAFSPDGIHWSELQSRRGPTGDRNSAFHNALRGVWVMSIRAYEPFDTLTGPQRIRRYWELTDLADGPDWGYGNAPLWCAADRLDLTRADQNHIQPQLYNLDAVAYESVLLGLFTIWRGGTGAQEGRPKPNEVCVGFSRDGFHWSRPERRGFMPISETEGDWNWGNVSSVGGCCLVVGERLHFYCSGRRGKPYFRDAGGATGLAFLRRDGFASMRAGDGEGSLTTHPLSFSGGHLFVNADAAGGEVRVEVLGEGGALIEGLTRDACLPVTADSTIAPVRWQGVEDLARLAGTPVRLRFILRNADLYAFWVSPDAAGASNGYVAAGGPGFSTNRDTVGAAAYEAAGAISD